jgi:hypothetical protein
VETLLVVDELDGNPEVLGELSKEGDTVEYTPTGTGRRSLFVWTAQPVVSTGLPVFIKNRIVARHNRGVDKFLHNIGLDVYDEWEILKRTNGVSPRDDLKFMTEDLLIEWSDYDVSAIKEIQKTTAAFRELFKTTAMEILGRYPQFPNDTLKGVAGAIEDLTGAIRELSGVGRDVRDAMENINDIFEELRENFTLPSISAIHRDSILKNLGVSRSITESLRLSKNLMHNHSEYLNISAEYRNQQLISKLSKQMRKVQVKKAYPISVKPQVVCEDITSDDHPEVVYEKPELKNALDEMKLFDNNTDR